MSENGYCVACKTAPYSNMNERLCIMCYGSPFYVKRRAEGKAPNYLEPAKEEAGLRYDDNKERVDLIPPDAMLELGRVYMVGARKYSERNWEKGMPWSKMVGPMLRHLFKFLMGEDIDPEDGQLHVAKIAWNAIGLLTYNLRKIGIDDVRIRRPQ